MEKWGKDARREAVIVDLDTLIPFPILLLGLCEQWISNAFIRNSWSV